MNLLVISKEAWADTRWARKQWLPYYLSQLDSIAEVMYLDRHAAWWRGESCHPEMRVDKLRVMQHGLLLPFERSPWVRGWNRRKITNHILHEMSHEESWVTLFYHPFDLAMTKALKKKSKIIFDWTEDWGVFHKDAAVEQLQRQSVEQSDVVLTVTKLLYERAVSWRGSEQGVFHVPNATALEVLEDCYEEPILLKNISHPRIGFVGHVGPWFDAELVAELAKRRADWHWVMIGGVGDAAKKVLGMQENIHYLGVQKPCDLMPLMKGCDVLVAPYIQGIQGDATKLYDYLVAKKPILSTSCETAELLQPWVRMCDTVKSWEYCLNQCLNGDMARVENASDTQVAQHHWRARAEQVEEILKRLQA